MKKPIEEIVEWLEERMEYYNYEYRYSIDDNTKKAIDIKRIETTEILDKIRDTLT